MPPSTDKSSPLSVHRAFVVQLRVETVPEHGRWIGRVEHVVSGQAMHFHDLADLLGFFARVLAQIPSSREP